MIKTNISSGSSSGASLSRYILVVLCIAVVFTALVLVVLNAWVNNKKLSVPSMGIAAVDQLMNGQTYEDGYRTGYLAAREKFKTIPVSSSDAAVTGLSGTIISLGNGIITIKAESLDTDPLVDGVSDLRKISVPTSTKITIRTFLSPEKQNELAEKWRDNGMLNDEPSPLPYTDDAVKLSDLKVGMQISVSASENIRLKESFAAASIIAIDRLQ